MVYFDWCSTRHGSGSVTHKNNAHILVQADLIFSWTKPEHQIFTLSLHTGVEI